MASAPPLTPEQYERILAPPLLRRAAALAWVILRHKADAEDAVQEAALRGLRALADFDPARPFAGWFLAIVRNCCRDALRRRQAHPAPADLDAAPPAAAPPGPSFSAGLADAMAHLSTAHRQVLELKYFGGCSYAEIAEALDVPLGTVMSRLHAARHALAAVYAPEARP